MERMVRCAIILLLAGSILMAKMRAMATVVESFTKHEVVPDLIAKAPEGLLTVKFPSGVEVTEGNVLTPTQMVGVPTLAWDASPDDYYTLLFTDLDAPTRNDRRWQEWRHWHVGNIPGNQVDIGDTLATYVSPAPAPGQGLCRYVFLVYKQKGKLNFDDEPRLPYTGANRRNFSGAKFVEKYDLGDPVAGNFFYSDWDEMVPILYKDLGLAW